MTRRIAAIGVCIAGIAMSAGADAKCKNSGEPVGAGCRRYAEDWTESPAFSIFFGPRSLGFRPTGRLDGTAPAPFDFAGSALDGGTVRSYGGYFGVTWAPSPYLYIGGELAAGEGAYHASSIAIQGLTLAPASGLNAFQIQGGALLGLRLPLGYLSLRAEVLGGGQYVDLSMNATSTTTSVAANAAAGAWLVEPRIALDVWATPYFTISGFAGMPDGDPRATTGGIAFAGHVRAFDGKFSL